MGVDALLGSRGSVECGRGSVCSVLNECCSRCKNYCIDDNRDCHTHTHTRYDASFEMTHGTRCFRQTMPSTICNTTRNKRCNRRAA